MVWLIRMWRAFLADAMSRNLAESMWNASARSLEAIAVAVRTLRILWPSVANPRAPRAVDCGRAVERLCYYFPFGSPRI